MKTGGTNFAYIMDLLGIKAADLCEATGADKTLVSRWRNGARKLIAGHHWASDIAAYFVEVDDALNQPVLQKLLDAYYPGEKTGISIVRENLLVHWLTNASQREDEYQQRREGVLAALMEKVEKLSAQKPGPKVKTSALQVPKLDNTVVYGVAGVQGSALQFIDLIMQQPPSQEVWYVCPQGLEMYTSDERFAAPFMQRLMEMFKAGHTLNVVLRTDYKMTDVSAFSGPWLVAHLMGYVKSHYFDEFYKAYDEKMLAVLQGKMAMRVMDGDKEGEGWVRTSIHFDQPTIDMVWNEVEYYRGRSKQRFHYNFFENMNGFLHGVAPLPDSVHYCFSRLPHFVLTNCANNLREYFGLTNEENERLLHEIGSLMAGPDFFEAPVRQIFCEEAIEEVLKKHRHTMPELSSIVGRRVMMPTQTFINQLVYIKSTMETRENYEVCFLPSSFFEKIRMQLCCWGDRAAIGWVTGGTSTACKDYTNANALTGFCEMVWNMVPSIAKNQRTAMHKLNTWLKKAEKNGYKV